jgi:dTDP-4-amino-4,6-dideoxygalactose transaminase
LPTANKENLPIAIKITEEVLCLPLYAELENENIERICKIISK